MVYSEYTWEYVKQLLKIDIQQTEDDNYYKFRVYIPCFEETLHIQLSKQDYYFKWVYYNATPEDEVIDKIIKLYNLEGWLSTKILTKEITNIEFTY